jgi:phosphoglycolate phosphatase-like HAD superfamily hydrolase
MIFRFNSLCIVTLLSLLHFATSFLTFPPSSTNPSRAAGIANLPSFPFVSISRPRKRIYSEFGPSKSIEPSRFCERVDSTRGTVLCQMSSPETDDIDAEILAWKRVEKVLTEKARAEAKKKAEEKAKAAAHKAPRPVLVWDVMNTICYDPFYVEVPSFFGMSLSDLYKAKDKSAWELFELGKISEQEMLKNFFSDRREFDHGRFVDKIKSHYAFLPGMEKLLDTLAVQGYPMHAMSNYPVWWKEVESRLSLSRFLRWSFVSCQTGVRKPDPAAYRHLLDALKVPAERCNFPYSLSAPTGSSSSVALSVYSTTTPKYSPSASLCPFSYLIIPLYCIS